MSVKDLIDRLDKCPMGLSGWKEFENICFEILKYLFIPPLSNPRTQARTYSGIDRRDAVFSNRNFSPDNIWGELFVELKARLILFEFKNYEKTGIGKAEVEQTRNYLNEPMGKLAILCCNKKPTKPAFIKRNTIYSQDKKVILFLTKKELKEMIFIKERGENPSDLIMDLVEDFYIQHE